MKLKYSKKCSNNRFSLRGAALLTALSVGLASCGGGGDDPAPATADSAGESTRTVSATKASQSGFNVIANLDALRITTGPFAGAYQVGVASNYVNWYFSNLGLLAFVKERPNQVRDYMNVYIANVDRSNYTINDVKFDGSLDHPVQCPADSNDSYASSLLSLASEYLKVTGDTAWFRQNLPTLKAVAYANLAVPQKPSGLISVFRPDYTPPTHPTYCPSFHRSDIAYTEDNAENYRGLTDFARALDSIGDTDSAYYKRIAASISAGMQQLTNGANFYVAEGERSINQSFYPGTVTQVFPQLYEVPVSGDAGTTQNRYDTGYAYLNERAPTWSTQIEPSASYPWMLLGYVAAKRGDKARAQQQMALLRANIGKAIINELGFYKRILDTGVSES